MADYALVDVEASEPTTSEKSDVRRVEVGELLGCQRMGARVWYLDPGETMLYHRHREQEELYLPLDGPGRMRIGEDLVDVPAGGAVRVPSETPRQMVNDGSERRTWLVVAAPSAESDGVPLDPPG